MGDEAYPTPPGGAGADSGAVDSTRVDDTERADIPNISSQNDIPGVGTRGPGGTMESDLDDAAADGRRREPAADQRETARSAQEEQVTDAATGDDLPAEAYEPGVDPESARTSRVVESGS